MPQSGWQAGKQASFQKQTTHLCLSRGASSGHSCPNAKPLPRRAASSKPTLAAQMAAALQGGAGAGAGAPAQQLQEEQAGHQMRRLSEKEQWWSSPIGPPCRRLRQAEAGQRRAQHQQRARAVQVACKRRRPRQAGWQERWRGGRWRCGRGVDEQPRD